MDDCLFEAYNFERGFRVRAEPLYLHEAMNKSATPLAKRADRKRYQSWAKRAKAPEQGQRATKWQALVKRSSKAAHAGRINLLVLIPPVVSVPLEYGGPNCTSSAGGSYLRSFCLEGGGDFPLEK